MSKASYYRNCRVILRAWRDIVLFGRILILVIIVQMQYIEIITETLYFTFNFIKVYPKVFGNHTWDKTENY